MNGGHIFFSSDRIEAEFPTRWTGFTTDSMFTTEAIAWMMSLAIFSEFDNHSMSRIHIRPTICAQADPSMVHMSKILYIFCFLFRYWFDEAKPSKATLLIWTFLWYDHEWAFQLNWQRKINRRKKTKKEEKIFFRIFCIEA